MDVWKEYLIKRGTWELTTDPEKADIFWFGSDSVLSDELLEKDVFKICYFWDILPSRMLDPIFREFIKKKVEQMRKCNLILTPSMTILYQVQMLGFPNVTLCTPGIDAKLIDSVDGGERKMQVCTVGRLNAGHKQHDWLIRAASMINPAPTVIMCGAGDPKPLMDLAKQLNVDLTIGPVSDEEKVRRIKESTCFITASAWEGFGMGPIEAMYASVPTLALDIPTHREMLKEYAIYFYSPVDLAEKMAFLMNNEKLREEMSKRGREYVANNLTFERATDRLEWILNHVIKQILGKKVRANPSRQDWIDIYDSEAGRSLKYHPYRADPHWTRFWEPRHYVKLLKKYGIKHVLDVGAGPTHPTIYALDGLDVSVCECSKVAIEQGKEIATKHGVDRKIRWVCGFGEELPYDNDKFDAVIQSHIWEHLPEPEKAIAEGLRVLKPGGILIGAVPLGTNYYDPLHLNVYSPDDIRNLVSKFSDRCEIVSIETIAEPKCDPSVILTTLKKVVK
ncbi:MAG: glycosyltransferase [Methanocellales archaeon]|nr:glycosyltransferase [Methanocellales archaeon]